MASSVRSEPAKLNIVAGNCHCGAIALAFSTGVDPADIIPRTCDCSFCTRHGALYVSDPAGQLRLAVKGRETLGRYQQGSRTADFLFCRGCGVLVAVVHERHGVTYGVVNARCLDSQTEFGRPEIVSLQKRSALEKSERWARFWIPEVRITVSAE